MGQHIKKESLKHKLQAMTTRRAFGHSMGHRIFKVPRSDGSIDNGWTTDPENILGKHVLLANGQIHIRLFKRNKDDQQTLFKDIPVDALIQFNADWQCPVFSKETKWSLQWQAAIKNLQTGKKKLLWYNNRRDCWEQYHFGSKPLGQCSKPDCGFATNGGSQYCCRSCMNSDM